MRRPKRRSGEAGIAARAQFSSRTATRVSDAKPLILRGWGFDRSHWQALAEGSAPLGKIEQSDDFLKLVLDAQPIRNDQIGDVLSFGLLDQSGFGPLVVVPPFADQAELTFVAKGVAARADDR